MSRLLLDFRMPWLGGGCFSLSAITIVHVYTSRAVVVQGVTVYGVFDCQTVYQLHYNMKNSMIALLMYTW